jgi:2-polyprenyl-3-methyl-5-hydroxy-6-metoxy-1,4-benzoquinol methylase
MTPSQSKLQTSCRVCGGENLFRYLDLGITPLANSYVSPEAVNEPEIAEELSIQVCTACGLSQLTRVVNPDLMFKNYLYVSSTPSTFRRHCSEMAAALIAGVGLAEGELVLDIASNDGCLLRNFLARGMAVVGVDPAENLAREANASGIPTLCDYWSPHLARELVRKFGNPKIITATNVIAHVDDLNSFMRGVSTCLAPRGQFVLECPYVLDFIENNEFDTAYHEHLSYIGITPLRHLGEAHGFELVDVSYFKEIHGGTIRVHFARRGDYVIAPTVNAYLSRETDFGIACRAPYSAFASRVMAVRDRLRSLLEELRSAGSTIWAYGASAKGNTLANFIGLTPDLIPLVIDDNPKKWNLLCPGSHIRIAEPSTLLTAPPDYLLLLAWNFEAEIIRRSLAVGFTGSFIAPVPEPRVISGREAA